VVAQALRRRHSRRLHARAETISGRAPSAQRRDVRSPPAAVTGFPRQSMLASRAIAGFERSAMCVTRIRSRPADAARRSRAKRIFIVAQMPLTMTSKHEDSGAPRTTGLQIDRRFAPFPVRRASGRRRARAGRRAATRGAARGAPDPRLCFAIQVGAREPTTPADAEAHRHFRRSLGDYGGVQRNMMSAGLPPTRSAPAPRDHSRMNAPIASRVALRAGAGQGTV